MHEQNKQYGAILGGYAGGELHQTGAIAGSTKESEIASEVRRLFNACETIQKMRHMLENSLYEVLAGEETNNPQKVASPGMPCNSSSLGRTLGEIAYNLEQEVQMFGTLSSRIRV